MHLRPLTSAPAWLAVLSLFVPALSFAAGHEVDAAAARATFDAGARAYSDKRFAEAAMRFEEAASLIPNSVALYTAAVAWERAGELSRAADDFGRALAAPGLSAQETAKAKERLASLESNLGALRVAGPAGVQVHLDEDGRDATVPVTLHGRSGTHTLVIVFATTNGGHLVERRMVQVESGKTIDLALVSVNGAEPAATLPQPPVIAGPNEPPDSKRASPHHRTKFAVGVALVGAGAAAEIGAALLWGAASEAGSAYRQQPTEAAFDHARSLETWTNAMLVAGSVVAIAGVACLLWPTDSGHRHAVSAGVGESRAMSVAFRVEPTSMNLVGKW